MTLQRSPRSEAGFALIEVVVSAAVLAIVALAVLSGLDAAGSSSAREKARSVAGALAEKDQERMRSFKFDALATVPQQPPVEVDGVTYTITSEARWITDDVNATPACGTASQKQSEYLKVTTTVTSQTVGTRIPAVKVESLVAPSVAYAQDHGTLAVKVVDRKNVGVPGITVNATLQGGGALAPTATNDQGCALFRSVHVGTYTISLNTPGFLGPKGLQLATSEATVNPNHVNVTSMAYDRAVTMAINVKTLRPGTPFTTTATSHDSKAWSVSDNAAETAVLRTFRASPLATFTTLTTPKLYPWDATSYSYFTGSCAYESPVFHGSTNYFSALTATPPGVNPEAAVKGDPTKLQPQPVTVFQPAINLRVRYRSNGATTALTTTELSKMNVFMTLVKPSGQTCTDAQYGVKQEMAIMDWPFTGWTPNPTTTGGANTNFVSQAATPATFDPGMPFGTYTVCLEDRNPTTTKKYTMTYNNTSPDGQPSVTLLPPASTTPWVSGTC